MDNPSFATPLAIEIEYIRPFKPTELRIQPIILPLLALFSACTGQTDKQVVETQYYQPEHEEVIIRGKNGDTIPTGEPTFFNWEGARNGRSVNFIEHATREVPMKPFHLDTNFGKVEHLASYPFILDSGIVLSPEVDTAIDPPKEVTIKPVKKLAIHPERVKVGKPVYKDNARYDIRCLSTDQGLPSNEYQDIFKDSRGYLWLGSEKGLSVFDGRFITTYTTAHGLSENFVQCIDEDQEGNIWLGTRSKGITKFDGTHFYHYNTDSIAPKRSIRDVVFDKNNDLWIAIQFGGFVHFDGETFYVYQKNQGVIDHRPTTAIVVNEDNSKWISNFGHGGYHVSDGGKVTRLWGDASVHSGYLNDVMLTSSGEAIWSHWGSRITLQKNDSVHLIDMPRFEGLEPLLITNSKEDQDGNIWLSAYGSGLYHWDRETDEVEHLGVAEGVSTEFVGQMLPDEHGGLWLGVEQEGLCYIKHNSFRRDNDQNGLLYDAILDIHETKNGEFYYATTEGVVKEDSSGFTYLDFVTNNTTDVMMSNSGILWYTSQNGGSTIIGPDGKGTRLARYGSPYNPTALDTSSNGDIWIVGMNSDLSHVSGDSVFISYGVEEGLNNQLTEDMIITDDDVFWFGSSYSGVAKIEGDSITYYTTNEKLKSNVVADLYEDNQGRIWIGTENGLNYYEDHELKSLNAGHPLLNTSIKSIIQDHDDRYWIATDIGLLALVPRVAQQAQFNLDDYMLFAFDKTNGLCNISFLADAIHVDSKNILRIGTKNGLIKRDLNHITFDRSLPSSFLTSVNINGKHIDYRALHENGEIEGFDGTDRIKTSEVVPFLNYPKTLALPHFLNHLTFEFSGLNWKDPHYLRCEYYLEGYETNWNDSRLDNIADYRNLSYGTYTFHLRTESRDGLLSEAFTYTFEINRPWWHTWWARVLYLLLFAGAVFGTVKWRTAKLRARQRQLEDEVEAATEEIREQKEVVEQAHQSLAIKNQEVMDSINYAKRIQSTIMPNQQLIKDLLPDNFIIYKPKDIVAGDFYWLEPIENGFLIAAADCTGHGVPGAMVSVVCNNALNRGVRVHGITAPDELLNMTREIVVDEFGQADEGVNDGMDIALCRVLRTKDGYQLDFAGANNPLWMIRKGADELEEIKGDKQPIGVFHDPTPFTNHQVKVEQGDSIYIFTDGYSDQFGGEKGKKFKTANFKKLITHIRDMEIEKQGDYILKQFEDWKQDFEQLDDVCVIGLRF